MTKNYLFRNLRITSLKQIKRSHMKKMDKHSFVCTALTKNLLTQALILTRSCFSVK